MHPVLGHIDAFDLTVRTYPVMLALAVLVGVLLAWPRALRVEGVTRARLTVVLLCLALGGFFGGRIHYLVNLGSFLYQQVFEHGRYGELFGFSFHAVGSILGLAIAGFAVLRSYGIRPGAFGDALVPAFGASLAIGRFACFLNGCCTGDVCALPWGVSFPKPTYVWNYHVYRHLVPADAVWSAPVHPLQLYFTAVGVVILLVGLWLEKRRRYEGQSILLALLIFASSNALLEQFRGYAPLRRFWFGVPQLTWMAVALAIATAVALLLLELRHSRRALGRRQELRA